MFAELKEAIAAVRGFVSTLEPRRLPAEHASALVDLFGELERLASAGRTLAGRRVEASGLWAERGYRTPAQWMAEHAKTSVSSAITTLEIGRRLEKLPDTRREFMEGSLSSAQASEICNAAVSRPAAEGTLLAAARTETVAALRDRCRQVVAAAADRGADERLHRSRYLRHWSDPDGAVRFDARLTPDAGARVIAAVQARTRMLRDQARASGSSERAEAHAADALVSLADQEAPGPRAVVHVHVDEAAWTRGRAEEGEMCRIPTVGPIPVAAARRLAEGGMVKAVLSEGADIRAVAHLGRTIPSRLRTALEARDQTCVVPGCGQVQGLEIDHVVPLAEGGPTRLDNLARLCAWHHSLKTHRGWRLGGGPGAWEWEKPSSVGLRPRPG